MTKVNLWFPMIPDKKVKVEEPRVESGLGLGFRVQDSVKVYLDPKSM